MLDNKKRLIYLIGNNGNGARYFIGKRTEADRKREYRLRIEVEKDRVGQMSGQISDKYPPKIEIEKELELDKDIKIYSPVIEYLNQKMQYEIYNSKKQNRL